MKVDSEDLRRHLMDLIHEGQFAEIQTLRAAMSEAESACLIGYAGKRVSVDDHEKRVRHIDTLSKLLEGSRFSISKGSDFNEYQNQCHGFMTEAVEDLGLAYLALGLGGEASELLEKLSTTPDVMGEILVVRTGKIQERVKKILRDKAGIASIVDVEEAKKELGDVLWYLAMIARALGLQLSDVAATNIAKLTSRKERDVINGAGDDR